jgi:hypothetical protein
MSAWNSGLTFAGPGIPSSRGRARTACRWPAQSETGTDIRPVSWPGLVPDIPLAWPAPAFLGDKANKRKLRLFVCGWLRDPWAWDFLRCYRSRTACSPPDRGSHASVRELSAPQVCPQAQEGLGDHDGVRGPFGRGLGGEHVAGGVGHVSRT